jgi:hypothetical protein
MTFFCQTEFILDDLVRLENFSAPEIRGIQEKRYNKEISLCVSGPDGNFFVAAQNPG